MRKIYFPWRYALTGVAAMSLLAPASLSAAETPQEAPQAQTSVAKRTVTGLVSDGQDGEPLIGATVQVEGDKSLVTTTNIDGEFTLQIPANKKNAILLVSYVGYKTRKVPVEDLGYIDIKMTADANTLDEVVVVGSGTQKKVSVTGAITSVSGESLRMPSSTLSTSIGGRVAGVLAQQKSGEPGSGAEFYIRGISTFGGRTTPLILLDDVEISSADLDYVPAENIESFSILKDASATAIYGARGANGVMIVKTKGGDYNQKTVINVSAEGSFNFISDFPDFVDGATFMEMRNAAMYARNPNLAPRYSQAQIDHTRSGVNPYVYPDVDWKDALFKDLSMRQKVMVSLTGGGSKVKYYMSLQAQHEDGNLNTKKLYSWNNNINIYNYTFQSNITYQATPSTTVNMRMNAQIRQNTSPNIASRNIFNNILTSNPVMFPLMYPDEVGPEVEHIKFGTYEMTPGMFLTNPFAQMNSSFLQANENTINTTVELNQDLGMLTPGLKFNAWVNFKSWGYTAFARAITPYLYKLDEYDENDPTGDYSIRLANTNGTDFISESDIDQRSDNTFEFQAQFSYGRKFAGVHDVNGQLIYRMREYRTYNKSLPNRNQGLSGRVTYDYDHRYLAEFNFGYNGTERLAKKDRFGFFPAGSIGWVISNEKFFEPVSPVISYLKVRGSYGLVGSDDLIQAGGSYFLYIDKITNNNLSYLTSSFGPGYGYYNAAGGPELAYYATQGIGWEKSKKLDLGIDMNLFRDFHIAFDYFKEKRYDIFLQREAWPQMLAYDIAKPYSNKGKVDNNGFEVSADYAHRINEDWSFNINGNFTYAKNKVIDWDRPVYEEAWVPENSEGVPLNATWGLIAEGLFKSQEEIDNSPRQDLGSSVMVGDIKYRDLNGDGIINNNDRTMISECGTNPQVNYGFGAYVQFRNWDLGVQFTGIGRRKIMMNGFEPFGEGRDGAATTDRNSLQWVADNYFDPLNPDFNAKYPRLGVAQTDVANNAVASTFWMRDGSQLRLRNVELGWSFKYGRVYVNGNNLLRFSKFKIWDPELEAWNSYPLSKTVTVGLQLHI